MNIHFYAITITEFCTTMSWVCRAFLHCDVMVCVNNQLSWVNADEIKSS